MSDQLTDFVPAALVHADLLAGMHRICFADAWDADAMASLLTMPGAAGLIAVDGGSLVPALEPPGPAGFVIWRAAGGEAEILTIAVLPPWRRAGLGRALLNHALDAVALVGAECMFLEAAADNISALALYEKSGFLRVGLRKAYYGDKDAVVMRRDLQTTTPYE
ncbi:MAG TPA: GNAT family N-acetyltransferase [Magnetospirillum sp.]|nr:GNAT family N-acetyltransferase [Magnetospirillum sp.]